MQNWVQLHLPVYCITYLKYRQQYFKNPFIHYPMKYAVFAIFLLISACTQTSPARQEKIRVTGEGKIRVKPDLVTFTLQVSLTEPRMASAVKTTQQTIDSVLAILAPYSQSEN